LERVAESLLIEKAGALPRLMSYGEIETTYKQEDSETFRIFKIVSDILKGFHPRTGPILWRIVICQACISAAVVEASRLQHETSAAFRPIREFDETQRVAYDWRQEGENISDDEAYRVY
jgi:hypothetical protein